MAVTVGTKLAASFLIINDKLFIPNHGSVT